MNRRAFAIILSAALFSSFGLACEDDDDGGALITLSAIVADPAAVQLIGSAGTMTFDFSATPLDPAQSDDLLAVLTSGLVALNVESDDTGVNFNLIEGTSVQTTPAAPGEYLVTATTDGASVTIMFFNSFGGYAINTANAYTATIDVVDNGYFTVESFTRSVTVTP